MLVNLNVVKSFHNNQRQLSNVIVSDSLEIQSEVKQGCVFDPNVFGILLFLLKIN